MLYEGKHLTLVDMQDSHAQSPRNKIQEVQQKQTLPIGRDQEQTGEFSSEALPPAPTIFSGQTPYLLAPTEAPAPSFSQSSHPVPLLRSPGPLRLSSSVQAIPQQSSSKPLLQSASVDNLAQPPAQCVPIGETITQGYIPHSDVHGQSSGKWRSLIVRNPCSDSPFRGALATKSKLWAEQGGKSDFAEGRTNVFEFKDSRVIKEDNVVCSSSQSTADMSLALSTNPTRHLITVKSPASFGGILGSESKSDSGQLSTQRRPLSKQTVSKIPRARPYARSISDTRERGGFFHATQKAYRNIEEHTPSAIGGDHCIQMDAKDGGIDSVQITKIAPSLKRKRVEDISSSLQSSTQEVLQPSKSESAETKSDDADTSAKIFEPTQKALEQSVEVSSPLTFQHVHKSIPGSSSDCRSNTVASSAELDQFSTAKSLGLERPVKHTFRNSPRRTMQTRKQAKTSPRRGKSKHSSVADPLIFGMTEGALRALTSSNTRRNQKYLAAKLETEVVRREGMRPTSPTPMLKTDIQHRQDDKRQERKERSARKTKGVEKGVMIKDRDRDGGSNDSSSDSRDETIREHHGERSGGEKPFESCNRREEHADEAEEACRRVKWDRDLRTAICVDEVKLGMRQHSGKMMTVKGCLAPKAKAASLDKLGNLANADPTLPELVEVSVVVKRFVYDDDVEPEPPAIIAKNSKLRRKKRKS